jgi:hypothetical protein
VNYLFSSLHKLIREALLTGPFYGRENGGICPKSKEQVNEYTPFFQRQWECKGSFFWCPGKCPV